MARKTVKVKIPENPDELILLLGKILAKHQSDGNNSPLKGLEMPLFETLLNVAAAANAEMQRLYELAKIETGKRDNAFGTAQTAQTLLYITTQIRDLLLVIYKTNPRELGQWGFDVIEGEAVSSSKEAKTKA